MMSWVRTATSLITFGFAFYKFFELDLTGQRQTDRLVGPREFGLMMISIVLVSLLMATIQHRQDRNELRALNPEVPRSWTALLAGLIALLGIAALLAVIFRQ